MNWKNEIATERDGEDCGRSKFERKDQSLSYRLVKFEPPFRLKQR